MEQDLETFKQTVTENRLLWGHRKIIRSLCLTKYEQIILEHRLNCDPRSFLRFQEDDMKQISIDREKVKIQDVREFSNMSVKFTLKHSVNYYVDIIEILVIDNPTPSDEDIKCVKILLFVLHISNENRSIIFELCLRNNPLIKLFTFIDLLHVTGNINKAVGPHRSAIKCEEIVFKLILGESIKQIPIDSPEYNMQQLIRILQETNYQTNECENPEWIWNFMKEIYVKCGDYREYLSSFLLYDLGTFHNYPVTTIIQRIIIENFDSPLIQLFQIKLFTALTVCVFPNIGCVELLLRKLKEEKTYIDNLIFSTLKLGDSGAMKCMEVFIKYNPDYVFNELISSKFKELHKDVKKRILNEDLQSSKYLQFGENEIILELKSYGNFLNCKFFITQAVIEQMIINLRIVPDEWIEECQKYACEHPRVILRTLIDHAVLST